MRRFLSLLLTLLALATLPLFPAFAQDRDKQACSADRGTTDIAACTRIIERPRASPQDRAIALTRRGNALRFRGELDRAIADYSEAVRYDPGYAPAFNGRGYSKLQKIKYQVKSDGDRTLLDSAIRDFDDALRANPRFLPALTNRADAYRLIGNTERSLNDIEQALRIDRNYGGAFFARAQHWRREGEIDRAIADYTEAIRRKYNLEVSHAGRGKLYELKGDLARAKADYQSALALPIHHDFGRQAQDAARKRLAAIAEEERTPIAAAPRTGDAGRRIALVIGNSAYKSVAALPNPGRDADTVAAALRRVGFQAVTVENDLTRDGLLNALASFARQAEAADWAVVYFAGHGIEVAGTNYLIPVDAKLDSDRTAAFEAVPLDQVMTAVEGAKRLRLVLLDACRDNPFSRQMRRSLATRSLGAGLAPVEPEAGTLVVYAAKHGQVALDGTGAANSPFAAAFVKNIVTPGIEVRKLFDLVRDDVMDTTNKRQQPFTYGSVPGRQDFFFVSR
jgi:tetratricopeptide (TPR) repeat protein